MSDISRTTISVPFERVDAANVSDFEKYLVDAIAGHENDKITVDVEKLTYISSAGLRVLMSLSKKLSGKMTITEVSNDVYEIFDVTGFTDILDVKKKLRTIDVSNATEIGRGGNGIVYRLNKDTIVKAYIGVSNTPEKIESDRLTSRTIFTYGIDTAIPFDTVKITGCPDDSTLGVVYEMIEADSLGTYLDTHPEDFEEYAHKFSALLKKLHATEVDPDKLCDARALLYHRMNMVRDSGQFTGEEIEIMTDLIDSLPTSHIFIHGDYHPGNILVRDGELVLIDVGDAGYGHPSLDFASLFLLCVVASQTNNTKRYCGLEADDASRLWDILIRDYFETDDSARVTRIKEAISLLSQVKLLQGVVVNVAIPEDVKAGAIKSMKPQLFGNADKIKQAIAGWDDM